MLTHTHTQRDLHFCNELGLLVSCGFDGAVKLWRRSPAAADAVHVADGEAAL